MDAVALVNLVINGVVEGLLVALPALALTLVMGVARFPNAATGDYVTLGAYAAVGTQALGVGSLALAALAGAAVTATVALVFYLWVFRPLAARAPVASLVASIGIAFLVRSLITLFVGHDQYTFQVPLTRAWNFGGVRLLPLDLAVGAVSLAAVALAFALLYLTRLGKQMRAVADNPELARASGIAAGRVRVTLWAVVGALCAIAGVLFGVKAVVMPELGWELLLPAFAAMILGGIGSPVGAVAGGVLLGVAQEISVPFVGPTYKLVVAFTVMLVVLLVRPRGLLGQPLAVR